MSKLPIFGLFLSVGNLKLFFSHFFKWFFSLFFSIELGPWASLGLLLSLEKARPGSYLVTAQGSRVLWSGEWLGKDDKVLETASTSACTIEFHNLLASLLRIRHGINHDQG